MNTHKTWNRFGLVVSVALLLLLLQSASLPVQCAVAYDAPTEEAFVAEDDPILTAIVVVKAASGASYMDDREYIATMPELKTIEEMRDFIARYEPVPEDAEVVRVYFESQGFNVISQDNLFLFISGKLSQFNKTVIAFDGSVLLSASIGRGPRIIADSMLEAMHNDTDKLIDGLLIFPFVSDTENTLLDSEKTKPDNTPIYSLESISAGYIYSVHDIANLLRVSSVLETGRNIDIGYIDEGLLATHPVFNNSLPHLSYAMIDGEIQMVTNNFIPEFHTGHGVMVASYLHAVAPDALLHSFALPESESFTQTVHNILMYLSYIRQHNILDILSLSLALDETYIQEQNGMLVYMSELRTEILDIMSNGTIVLAGAGNSGQCIPPESEYCLCHNAIAAIPEVIAVGGASFQKWDSGLVSFSGASGYDVSEDGHSGAASFASSLYPGRNVPDIVGIFGISLSDDKIDMPWVGSKGTPYYLDSNSTGTSGATPQISGITALLKEKYPELNQTQVRAILQSATFDIQSGESGDGDLAGPGYDLATGHGLPMADRVMSENQRLYPGWNLIGLTKDRGSNFTADDLLAELQAQESSCNAVTQWIRGRYESRIIIDGLKFGSNFTLEPGVAYWVRCTDRGLRWQKPAGIGYITTPQTIHLKTGWNFFSIPYSESPCTVTDVWRETDVASGACSRVMYYNGQFQEAQRLVDEYGQDFVLTPGQGYAMYCIGEVEWTPDCRATYNANQSFIAPQNVYIPSAQTETQLTNLLQTNAAMGVHIGCQSLCTPQNVRLSNISNHTFSASWTTTEPCMGSLIIHNGSNPLFRAYDDRGTRYAGTTHHVTVRGLTAETIYAFGLLSGDMWDDNGGNFYHARTGAALNISSNNFSVLGQVLAADSSYVQDALVYVRLEDSETQLSSLLSLPTDLLNGKGYAITLDNARVADMSAYFDYTTAISLHVETQGGSTGQQTAIVPVDLTITPHVTATTLAFTVVTPDKPTTIGPNGALVALRPTFSFSTTHIGTDALFYRLELSTDNFATIARIYDQQHSSNGWSNTSYTSGQVAQFMIPDTLENFRAYQWRVFAYTGEAWSSASDIAAFAITRYYNLYLPLILRNASGSTPPALTPTSTPTATATPSATPTPDIPAPIGPTVTPTPTPIPTPQTIRVSVSSSGEQGNANSSWPSVSANGRYVVFQSSANNLVPNDTNGVADVFVYDFETGQTQRVSVASDGTQGDNFSGYYTAISADGNYIAFESAASNLVSRDTNQKIDVFVHNRQTGETTRVSVASDGTQGNGDSGRYGLSISTDGRYVAFKSYSSNLVSGGTCGVLVHDRQTAQTTCISVSSTGAVMSGTEPSISADGRYVAFEAPGDLLSGGYSSSTDVYVRDFHTNQTVRASVASNGVVGDRESTYPIISSDGRYVAFVSRASNLVSGDTNGVEDIFVHDLQTQQTTRVSVASDGTQGSWPSGLQRSSALSGDGRYVTFVSLAKLVGDDIDNQYDVYVRDRQTNQTICVSVSNSGVPTSTGSSYFVSMSGDGRRIAFTSTSADLVTGDTNDSTDVFTRDRGVIE